MNEDVSSWLSLTISNIEWERIRMKQRGFSLIGTVCIILLSAVLMETAVIGNYMVERARLEGKVNEVVQGIELVRNASIFTGRQYNLFCFDNRILLRQSQTCFDKIYLSSEMYIPSDITGGWIRFNGTAAPLRAGTILINDKRLKMRARITVGVATGKVNVYYEAL